MIVVQGSYAHAEGYFAKTFLGKLNRVASEEAQAPELEARLNLQLLDEMDQEATEGTADTQRVSYSESKPVCNNGCSSWYSEKMCDGTGAWGGDSRFAGSITLGTDTFFGLYPIISGAYAINERVDATFYGWLWTTEALAATPGDSRGPWTEVGGGLNFKFMDGDWQVNPQFGILNGALLSNTPSPDFNQGSGSEPRIFDGVVPTITINHSGDFTEGQFYMGYYVGTRGQSERQNDFLHWWINSGIKPWADENSFRSTLSTGAHYEMLRDAKAESNLYAAVGPYFQVALPNGLSLRWTACYNTDRESGAIGSNFYKLWATYSF